MILDSVLQAVDFIEENLKNNISVLDVSNRACYSIYHFIRMFEGITGHTPKDYILRRRICESARRISEGKEKIIDIAFDYQFGSPEVFSRAFKRIAGIRPSEYQKESPHTNLLARIDGDALKYGSRVKETDVELVELDSIELCGMVILVRKDKSIIDEIWKYMSYELQDIPGSENITSYYGHSFWSNDYDLNGFFLLCGFTSEIEVDIKSPFCRRTVPGSRYLKFVHKGDVHDISLSYKYIFQTYLPKTDFVLRKPYDFEVYHVGEVSPDDPKSQTEILLPVE
jgi:AraC family transcriptional regulator